MNFRREIIILAAVYLAMLFIIFILPFYSLPGYSIVRNTTSQLGAQNTPNAWIMNLTFAALGAGSVIAGWRRLKGFIFHRVILLVFGISLIMTAIYRNAPVESGIAFNILEDRLHSLFASTTGFSFTVFAFATAFILDKDSGRILAVSMGILATVLSVLMFNLDSMTGILQRILFTTTFAWLLYMFNSLHFSK